MQYRKNVVTVLAILAASLAPLARASDPAAPATPRPKIVVPEMVFETPELAKGELGKHEWVIENAGDKTLEISEVSASCSCTVTSFDKSIPPGGKGKIAAEADTSKMRGGQIVTVTVFSNDPDTPRVDLTFRVKVVDHLIFNPGLARFIRGHGWPPGEVKQIFFNTEFEGLEIEKIESPYPFLKIESREATEQERRKEGLGKQFVLTMTLDYNQAPVGPLNGDVLVYTNHPKQKIGRLTISGMVRPLVAVTPPRVDFGDVNLSDGIGVRFLVDNLAQAAMKLTEVPAAMPGMTTKIEEIEPGRKFSVEMMMPADLPKGPFAFEFKIQTDNSRIPVLVVPVKGVAR